MEFKTNRGCVYFFRHIGLTPIKIGYSENESPIHRFNQFKTYAPYGSEILGFIIISDAKELESVLHRKYSSKRLNGEWFEITEDEVNYEINFYSNVSDVKDRNDFQIAWAKYLENLKNKIQTEVQTLEHPIPKFNQFKNYYSKNPNLNKSHFARKFDVSRECIYKWVRKINKE
jgi:hypothetical protein